MTVSTGPAGLEFKSGTGFPGSAFRSAPATLIRWGRPGIDRSGFVTNHCQPALDQFFDIAQISPLARIAKGNRRTARTGPRCPPDPVDIIFRLIGEFVIDDMADGIHIDAAGRDIGHHQDPRLAVAVRTLTLASSGATMPPSTRPGIAPIPCSFSLRLSRPCHASPPLPPLPASCGTDTTVRFRLPCSSLRATCPGSTTVVESICSRIAGPSRSAPQGRPSRA